MLENMIELIYSKMGLSLLLLHPEKKDIIRSFREKYESDEEYEKLLEKISEFKKSVREAKEKINKP